MNIHAKIYVDMIVGRIICIILHPLVFVLGKMLHRNHSITAKNVKTIAVAKYFGLGSITHAMPMLRALKIKYPDSHLVFVTRCDNAQLIALISDIDEALYMDDSTLLRLAFSSVKLLGNLIIKRVDIFFDLEIFSAYGALISLISLSRNRMGFLSGQSTDFKAWIYTDLMYFNFHSPVRQCYMQLASMAGITENASIDLIPYAVPHESRDSAIVKLNI